MNLSMGSYLNHELHTKFYDKDHYASLLLRDTRVMRPIQEQDG